MSKIARDIAPRLTHQVIRLRERHLLEGAMAASALVAMADRKLRMEESIALGSALENLELLSVHDPQAAVDLYGGFLDALREDWEDGKRLALGAVARCRNDLEAAELLVKVGIAIAKADSEFASEEIAVVREICSALEIEGLDPVALVGLGKPRLPH